MIPHFLWFSLASTAIPETLIPGSHRYSRNTVCLIPEQLRGIAVGSGNKRFGNTGNKRFGNKLEYSQDQTDEPASNAVCDSSTLLSQKCLFPNDFGPLVFYGFAVLYLPARSVFCCWRGSVCRLRRPETLLPVFCLFPDLCPKTSLFPDLSV